MDVEALADSSASLCYVTPSHQFPMGSVMPASTRDQLLKWLPKRRDAIFWKMTTTVNFAIRPPDSCPAEFLQTGYRYLYRYFFKGNLSCTPCGLYDPSESADETV